MFCQNCGEKLDADMKFCPSCGSPAAPAVENVKHAADNTSETHEHEPSFVSEQAPARNDARQYEQPIQNQPTANPYNRQYGQDGAPVGRYETQGVYIPPSAAEYQKQPNGGAYYGYENSGYTQTYAPKKSKAPVVIACSVAAAVVAAVVILVVFLAKGGGNTPKDLIKGTWATEYSGVSIEIEFNGDGTVKFANADSLTSLIGEYIGSDYGINYDAILDMINIEYEVSDDDELTLSYSVSFYDSSQSASFTWTDDASEAQSSYGEKWYVSRDKLYLSGVEFTRQ